MKIFISAQSYQKYVSKELIDTASSSCLVLCSLSSIHVVGFGFAFKINHL